jgi:hypothetical protein
MVQVDRGYNLQTLYITCLEKKEIMRNIRSLYVLSWEIVRLKTVT